MIESVSGNTVVCGLIGSPISHSISPLMHNAAFTHLGLDYIYVPLPVKPEALSDAIGGMRALSIRGLNVTAPHKVAVIPLIDEMDSLARQIGAVNTIVNNEGELKGYNTDALGFIQVLADKGYDIKGKKIVVVGAGGAARAITFALADKGAELTIINRRQEFGWAIDLSSKLAQTFRREVNALELSDNNLTESIGEADLLVNATTAGMTPDIENTPVAARFLRRGMLVFDIVYSPLETRLLREARQAGARTISGLDMVVAQGALSFELWTGQKAPVDIMKEAAIKGMKNEV